MVIPFQEIIRGDISEFFLDAVSRFSCRDRDVEMFLKRKSFDFERRNRSRSYLIFDDNGIALRGYFTLSLKALPFTEKVSKSTIKSIDGFSKDVKAVGIILIGQFGKDRILSEDIDGTELFNECIKTVYAAQKIIGGRFVMLECQKIESVVSFYEKNGFEYLQLDEKDGYLQMIRRLD